MVIAFMAEMRVVSLSLSDEALSRASIFASVTITWALEAKCSSSGPVHQLSTC